MSVTCCEVVSLAAPRKFLLLFRRGLLEARSNDIWFHGGSVVICRCSGCVHVVREMEEKIWWLEDDDDVSSFDWSDFEF